MPPHALPALPDEADLQRLVLRPAIQARMGPLQIRATFVHNATAQAWWAPQLPQSAHAALERNRLAAPILAHLRALHPRFQPTSVLVLLALRALPNPWEVSIQSSAPNGSMQSLLSDRLASLEAALDACHRAADTHCGILHQSRPHAAPPHP